MSAKCSTREIGYPSSTGLGRRASRLRLMMRCVSTKGNNKSVCQSAAAWWQVFFSSSSLSSLSFESQEESGSVMQTTIDLVSPLIGSLTTLVLYVVGPSGTCHHGDNRQRQHLHISPTHHHPPVCVLSTLGPTLVIYHTASISWRVPIYYYPAVCLC